MRKGKPMGRGDKKNTMELNKTKKKEIEDPKEGKKTKMGLKLNRMKIRVEKMVKVQKKGKNRKERANTRGNWRKKEKKQSKQKKNF